MAGAPCPPLEGSADAPFRRREGTPPLWLVVLELVLLLLTCAQVAWRKRPAAWLGMGANSAWNSSFKQVAHPVPCCSKGPPKGWER